MSGPISKDGSTAHPSWEWIAGLALTLLALTVGWLFILISGALGETRLNDMDQHARIMTLEARVKILEKEVDELEVITGENHSELAN